MPLGRLLAIALLLFPFTAFGQVKQNDSVATPQQATVASTTSERWRILRNDPAKASSIDRVSEGRHSETPGKGPNQGVILEDVARTAPEANSVVLPGSNFVFSPGAMLADNYCLKIRSYVVARDSKDSDSTHFVSYSTCQPASRYQLRTTELQTQPANR